VSRATGRGGAGRRVLIVDDDADFRLLIRMHLEDRGHQIVGEASNGASAISAAYKLDPDVITLDYQMPLLTGELALEHIREISPDAKVVVVSATISEPPEWADDFLPKDRLVELPDVLDRLFG
jgi:two-component system chemotaxis response regulator CheY